MNRLKRFLMRFNEKRTISAVLLVVFTSLSVPLDVGLVSTAICALDGLCVATTTSDIEALYILADRE